MEANIGFDAPIERRKTTLRKVDVTYSRCSYIGDTPTQKRETSVLTTSKEQKWCDLLLSLEIGRVERRPVLMAGV